MSWSFYGVGKPKALGSAIDRYANNFGDTATSQSRREYDEAAPALKTLVGCAPENQAVSVNASGHASFDGEGRKTSGNISVEIKTLGMLHE